MIVLTILCIACFGLNPLVIAGLVEPRFFLPLTALGWVVWGIGMVLEMAPGDYLREFSPWEYGAIYGWDPYLQDWISNPDKLVPGRGYWIPFSAAGTINP